MLPSIMRRAVRMIPALSTSSPASSTLTRVQPLAWPSTIFPSPWVGLASSWGMVPGSIAAAPVPTA